MIYIHNLPLDVLHCIIEHLSLDDLVCISDAFESTANAASSIIKRHAVNVVTALLVTGQARNEVVIADNGDCYKFQLKNPRAGPYRHQQDHAKKRPCGEVYNPNLPHALEYKRTFHENPADDTKTEMIIHANNGKSLEHCARKIRRGSHGPGPAEMVMIMVQFSRNLQDSDGCGILHLEFDTLSETFDDTFTDTFHSQLYLTRTITHGLPLRGAYWIDSKQKTALPLGWFAFLGSGISARSTFSKTLVVPHSPDSEDGWQWRMLSFEISWSLSLPLSGHFS
jgi:hypothetical protein